MWATGIHGGQNIASVPLASSLRSPRAKLPLSSPICHAPFLAQCRSRRAVGQERANASLGRDRGRRWPTTREFTSAPPAIRTPFTLRSSRPRTVSADGVDALAHTLLVENTFTSLDPKRRQRAQAGTLVLRAQAATGFPNPPLPPAPFTESAGAIGSPRTRWVQAPLAGRLSIAVAYRITS